MKLEKWNQKGGLPAVVSGCPTDYKVVDGRLVSITFGDVEIVVNSPEYNYISVLIPAKPKMEKRYQLTGTLAGITVNELFEHRHEAQARKLEILRECSVDDTFLITEVDVPEE